MLSISLLEEALFRSDGVGPSIDVTTHQGKLLVLTLGITHIFEHEYLEVSIMGSPDGKNWGTASLVKFPRKSYCGMYSTLLNLSASPQVCYVRVQWKMSYWKKIKASFMCAFYLTAEESGSRVRTAFA
ncbi:MAG: hypothetical protein JO022_18075 [Acidobacteriaceae bacterium]|nr:hypothetical protein [Acidobacteriaceae bacterium]